MSTPSNGYSILYPMFDLDGTPSEQLMVIRRNLQDLSMLVNGQLGNLNSSSDDDAMAISMMMGYL